MQFFKRKKILIVFILFTIITVLFFWNLLNKAGGDCSRNKNSLITIGKDKIYCDREGKMWSHTLPGLENHILPGSFNWDDAINACQNLTYAGKEKWRLPNISELEDLYNLHGSDYPYITCDNREFIDWNFKNNWDVNICMPSNPSGHYYWSSSEFETDTTGAWRIFGYDGSSYVFGKTSMLSVRCVN